MVTPCGPVWRPTARRGLQCETGKKLSTDTLLENDGSRGTSRGGERPMSFWTTALIIACVIWVSAGLARMVARRDLQHQQIIGMLNTMYGTQTGHGAIIENVQIDLIAIRARLGIPQTR
jgi:hypothetical protein